MRERKICKYEKKSYLAKARFISGFFILLFSISFVLGLTASTSFSNPQYFNPSTTSSLDSAYSNLMSGPYSRGDLSSTGEEFYDMEVMIPPGGCKPMVVRSDLLEEQNVPVFCELVALKLNPGVDISRIDRITFAQKQTNDYISGIGFHPAYTAIKSRSSISGTPMNGRIGYVVVVLKKQPNEKAMPSNVSAVLSAVLEYGTENPAGLGPSDFYLPEMSDDEFSNNYLQYGFLNGLGYLRAENVDSKGAMLSIYTSNDKKIFSSRIEEGKTSRDIFIYNTGFVGGRGVRLELKDLTIPQTKAKIRVNGATFEVYKGGKFGDGKCTLNNVVAYGGGAGKATVSCSGKSYELLASFVQVDLMVDAALQKKSVGEKLETIKGSYYVAYLGNMPAQATSESKPFVVIIGKKSGLIDEAELKRIANKIESATKDYNNDYSKFNTKLNSVLDSYKGSYEIVKIEENAPDVTIGTTDKVTLKFTKAENFNKDLNTDAETFYKKAIDAFEDVLNRFRNEKNPDSSQSYGADSLWQEYNLAQKIGKTEDSISIFSRIQNEYPESKSAENSLDVQAVSDELSAKRIFSSDKNSAYSQKDNLYVELISVSEPSENEASISATVSWTNDAKDRKTESFSIKEKETFVNEAKTKITLDKFSEDKAYFSYNCEKVVDGKDISKTGTKEIGTIGVLDILDCNAQIKIEKINLKQVAQVKIVPISYGKSRETNFTFSIGIEKRAFAMNLTPEEANSKIESLNKKIADLREITSVLNKTIRAGKLACLGTSVTMNVMNLFSGFTGEATARNQVMTMEGGWNDICKRLVSEDKYSDEDSCIRGESSGIEKDINTYKSSMEFYNNQEKGYRASSINPKTNKVDSNKVHDGIVKSLQTGGANAVLVDGLNEKQKATINNPDFTKSLSDSDLARLIVSLKASQGLSTDMKKSASTTASSLLSQANANIEALNPSRVAPDSLNGLPSSYAVSEKTSRANYAGLIWNEPTKTKYSLQADSTIDDKLKEQQFVRLNIPDLTEGGAYLAVVEGSKATGMRISDGSKIYKMTEDGSKNIFVSEAAPSAKDKVMEKYGDAIFEVYDDSAYKNPCSEQNCNQIWVFDLEPFKGMPSKMPFDFNEGWYVEMKSLVPSGTQIQTYYDSGKLNSFYLCNIGKNKLLEGIGRGDDICRRFDLSTGDLLDSFPNLDKNKVKQKVSEAIYWVSEAQSQLSRGLTSVTINRRTLKVVKTSGINDGSKCTDFMSAKQCQIMFNVCDPFVCPTSRCDLGGEYPVDNVIASGIVGSVALCLPNFIGFRGGDVAVPVCLTGIHAGIDGWVSMLESYRDCINASVTNNVTVGICDEIQSVYVCDFFWKQAGPYFYYLTKNLFSGAYLFGKGTKGGGEYMFAADAFSNAEKSWQYFTGTYAANSKLAFGARSLADVGADVCKMQMSATYPNKWDALLEPESPVQFNAWFQEMPYTSATVTPKSQYKVFYHIYAGADQSVQYSVYLKGSSTSLGYTGAESTTVESGYIEKGGRKTETRDFIADAGFKELCVRINGKDNCGFKVSSTSFALNYAKDKAVEDMATNKVTSERECISGSASVWGLATPNLQQAAEQTIDPQLYNYGVIRICASDNPGKGVEPSRWKEVGYCDDTGIKCWVDENSVKKAITGKGIENQTISEIDALAASYMSGEGYLTPEQAPTAINQLVGDKTKGYLKFANDGKFSELDGLDEAVKALNEKLFLPNAAALLYYKKALVYKAAAIRAADTGVVVPVKDSVAEPGIVNPQKTSNVDVKNSEVKTYDISIGSSILSTSLQDKMIYSYFCLRGTLGINRIYFYSIKGTNYFVGFDKPFPLSNIVKELREYKDNSLIELLKDRGASAITQSIQIDGQPVSFTLNQEVPENVNLVSLDGPIPSLASIKAIAGSTDEVLFGYSIDDVNEILELSAPSKQNGKVEYVIYSDTGKEAFGGNFKPEIYSLSIPQ